MNLPTSGSTDYHAYLLRIWREDPAGPWRATLENAYNGERCGFASMDLLFLSLEQQTQAEPPPCSIISPDSPSPAVPRPTK